MANSGNSIIIDQIIDMFAARRMPIYILEIATGKANSAIEPSIVRAN